MSPDFIQRLVAIAIVVGAALYIIRRVTIRWRDSMRSSDRPDYTPPCGCGCHDAAPKTLGTSNPLEPPRPSVQPPT